MGQENSRGRASPNVAAGELQARGLDATLIFRVTVGVAATGVAALLWSAVCTVPAVPWNAARLAPSFALVFGQPIYALRDSGAHLGWFYGPLFPLWYLPVTITGNPTIALAMAALLNMATLIMPAVLAVYCAGMNRPRMLGIAAVFSAALLLGSPTLRWLFYFVHVDVVCLACGIIACVALHRAVGRASGWAMHLAALAMVLAFWTKHIAVMLAPGMFLWLWFEGHRKQIWPLFFWGGIYTALTTALTFAVFGTEEVLFNLVLFHSANPVQKEGAQVIHTILDLGSSALPWLPVAACCLGRIGSRSTMSALPSEAASLVRLLLWVAFSQLPLGLIAAMKVGGAWNSVHSLLYAFVGGLVVAVFRMARPIDLTARIRLVGMAWSLALLIPVASACWLAGRADVSWTIYRGHERALEMVRAAPGRYYFPWNPLVMVMGERRVYPFDDALLSLWRSGLEVPPEKVRAVVPLDPIIVYEGAVQSRFALRYFPDPRKSP